MNSKVSNDTLPNNVLILHDSALYCDNTDHEQMLFFTRSGVPSADLRIGVPSDDYVKNMTRRPRIADLKKQQT